MKRIKAATLHYPGNGGCESFCGVSVFKDERKVIVVVEEHPDNKGTSVTNAIERVANAVVAMTPEVDFARTQVTWVEHYPSKALHVMREETFDTVFFARNAPYSAPRWQPFTRAKLEQLIGQLYESPA